VQVADADRTTRAVEDEAHDVAGASDLLRLALLHAIEATSIHHARLADRKAAQEAQVPPDVLVPSSAEPHGRGERIAALLQRDDVRTPP
jgi:hypothetical protein